MTSRSLGIQIMNLSCLSRYHVQGKVSLGHSQAYKKIPWVWRRVASTSHPVISITGLVNPFSTPSHQNSFPVRSRFLSVLPPTLPQQPLFLLVPQTDQAHNLIPAKFIVENQEWVGRGVLGLADGCPREQTRDGRPGSGHLSGWQALFWGL